MEHMQHGLAWWPTLIVLAVATVTDLRSRRIPNWLVFPFLLAGIVISPLRARLGRHWPGLLAATHAAMASAWHGLGQSLAGAGAWSADFWGSFLDGRHGRRGREAVRRDRGLDRPDAVVLAWL